MENKTKRSEITTMTLASTGEVVSKQKLQLIKTNVIIFIKDAEIMVKDVEYNAATYNNWHVIYAQSTAEADRELSTYLGASNLKNLVVRSHGGGNTIQMVNFIPPNIKLPEWPVSIADIPESFQIHLEPAYLENYLENERDPEKVGSLVPYRFMTALENIVNKVEDGGVVVYTACNAGLDWRIDKFAKQLTDFHNNSSERNLKIYLNSGKSKRIFQYDFMKYYLKPFSTGIQIGQMGLINKDPDDIFEFQKGFRLINTDGTHQLLRDITGGKGTITIQDKKDEPLKMD